MNEKRVYPKRLQPAAPDQQALYQLADLCERIFGVRMISTDDGHRFDQAESRQKGVIHISGRLTPDGVALLRLELVHAASNTLVNSSRFFQCLASLGERTRLVPPEYDSQGLTSLFVEVSVAAIPLSFTRLTALTNELNTLEELAVALQAETPRRSSNAQLDQQYSAVADWLEPAYPLPDDLKDGQTLFWARDCADFLLASAPVAISCACAIDESFSLSAVASILAEYGTSLGKVALSIMGPRTLLESVRRAPGTIAVPASRLNLGTNIYEVSHEVPAMLAALNASGIPVLFTGSEEQLRLVFHGGQGAIPDPLSPVVRHAPVAPLSVLVRFALQLKSKSTGGLSPSDENKLTHQILDALKPHSYAQQKRLVTALAGRTITLWKKGKLGSTGISGFANAAVAVSETLAGMTVKPRASRTSLVEESYIRTLTDPELAVHLKQQLLGQDAAIDQFVRRLKTEVLTRPAHQPLRYCAQGTPATGKSESAVLLASRLGIPYVNVDASSIPDYYSAAAQLLGSGRGIVGSYQSGRLEQAAKQHTGVLMEISDLDHANDRVRSGLADLFLQVLETGEAQSAAGAMFSCANVIFAFTMNLPDGMDEKIRKGFGFTDAVDDDQLQHRVSAEIKKMLSGAFLSRIGTPILFAPLKPEAMAEILERAICAAMYAARERLQLPPIAITVAPDVGAAIAETIGPRITSFGARALLEHGRMLAASAVTDMHRSGTMQKNEYRIEFEKGQLLVL